MKKILSLLLVLIMIIGMFTFASCGEDDTSDDTNKGTGATQGADASANDDNQQNNDNNANVTNGNVISFVVGSEVYSIQSSVTLALPEKAPEKAGYAFEGWFLDRETTSMPVTNETLNYLSFGKDTTIYAKLTPVSYKITYDVGKGATNNNPATYTIESDAITLVAPTRSGFSFDGWYNGETKITEIPKGTTGDLTITAKWTANGNFSVKFLSGGGTGTMEELTYKTSETPNLPINEFTKTDYVFAGWKDSKGNTYYDGQKISAPTDGSELKLTAVWRSALGFDISEYQNGIDFDDLVAENPGFIILRAAAYYDCKDACFEEFYAEAKRRNIPVGAYFFSYAYDAASGLEEAEYFYNDCLKGKTFEYPVFMDVESSTCKNAGSANLTAGIEAFCDYILSKGYYPGVYTYAYFLDYMDIDRLNAKYDVWIAGYVDETEVSSTHSTDDGWLDSYGNFTMWQWTSEYWSYGLDANFTYRDYETFIKRFGFNGFTAADPNAEYKTYMELAQEVLDNKWSYGDERYQKLIAAGYDYNGVQDAVSYLLAQG